jgi:hypothetical protein
LTKLSITEDNSSNDIGDILFTSVATNCCYFEIFYSTFNLFLKVSLSQLRRDYLAFVKKNKGKSLRKKVIEKSKRTSFF